MSSIINCKKCTRQAVDWGDGLCITCARNEVLGFNTDQYLSDELFELLPPTLEFEGLTYRLELYTIEPIQGLTHMAGYYNRETDVMPNSFYAHGDTSRAALQALYGNVRLLQLYNGKVES